ncbi:MAG: anaerobic glycerol-3-phosphate dehydrogenase subunit A [Bacteroidaceae bacterium]|nr:anaerobic glycerol-3-phosphate dehydrogenase subunit A [Bacteroidaceae bacterium]
MSRYSNKEYDVIIIGGGITGMGTARDCSMRGLKTLLLERDDFATGATGRNHGLLHSGARYAVGDSESAAECIAENMILRQIAPGCIEQHDGLFISLPEDDLGYQTRLMAACRRCGIPADIIDPEEAKRIEPTVNPALIGAVRVPDGSIDPFRLVQANELDARLHSADILSYHEVVGMITRNGRVEGVEVRDNRSGEQFSIRSQVTVNAAGIWGMVIARMAGVEVKMFPGKGALLIFANRLNKMVINRCHKASNGDILVPDGQVTILGSTSDRVPIGECDDMHVTPEEVKTLLREGTKMVPTLANTRILRAYAGVRPLVADDDDASGRGISRGIVCIDHEKRDGLAGFITITGGKLMTYRLMAERATDMVCAKLNIERRCETARIPLPELTAGSRTMSRRGMTSTLSPKARGLYVCECHKVTLSEITDTILSGEAETLIQLRRRCRLGMGKCAGRFCALRAARLMCSVGNKDAMLSMQDLADFIRERWKGISPIAWGTTLADGQYMASVYQGLCGIH